jgi:hypothetical protein
MLLAVFVEQYCTIAMGLMFDTVSISTLSRYEVLRDKTQITEDKRTITPPGAGKSCDNFLGDPTTQEVVARTITDAS